MKENKHDHKLTKKLKAILFSIVMLMPFLTCLPTALYYAFNEHATNSQIEQTNIVYKYETNEVNDLNDIIEGNIYKVTINSSAYDYTFYSGVMYIKGYIDEYSNFELTEYAQVIISDWDFYIYYGNSNNIRYIHSIYMTINNKWILPYDILENVTIEQCPQEYIPIDHFETTTEELNATNSVARAWKDTWTNELYAWASESPLKQPINAFTQVFNISASSYITEMLTYFATITTIYIVFDIIIECVIWLTHFFSKEK